jgi:hypothetical protein
MERPLPKAVLPLLEEDRKIIGEIDRYVARVAQQMPESVKAEIRHPRQTINTRAGSSGKDGNR